MTERGKVLDSLANPFGIIHLENVNVGKVRCSIHENQRKFALDEFLDQVLFDAEGHDGDTIHVALEQAAHQAFGAGWIVIGGADQDFIALRHGQIFEFLHELGKEGVGDLGDDEPQHFASAGNEGAGLRVGQVPDFFDGLPDALRELGVHGRNMIHGARDGGDGDAGALRDIANADRGGAAALRWVVFRGAHVGAILHLFSRVSQ
jgi:hypothetical protein